MNHSNMIEVFDAVTGGIDGSASVDDWETMSIDDVRQTADGMADNFYEPLSEVELDAVSNAIIKAQSEEQNFREVRSSLDEK